jgi:hypothetical protein
MVGVEFITQYLRLDNFQMFYVLLIVAKTFGNARHYTQSRYNRGCLRPILDMEFQFLAIWAAQGISEKKIWADYEQLLGAVFPCFHGQKNV